jgi:hypothetical protein
MARVEVEARLVGGGWAGVGAARATTPSSWRSTLSPGVRSDAVAAGPESGGGCVLGVGLLLSLLENKS